MFIIFILTLICGGYALYRYWNEEDLKGEFLDSDECPEKKDKILATVLYGAILLQFFIYKN